jgi:hypothetical protein
MKQELNTADSGQAHAKPISKWSWVLIGFTTLLAAFSSWVQGNPYDIGGALGRTVGTLLIPFAVAYVFRGMKGRRDWNSFARWYFWLGLAALMLSQVKQH